MLNIRITGKLLKFLMPSPIKSESLGLEPSPPHFLKLIQRFQLLKKKENE